MVALFLSNVISCDWNNMEKNIAKLKDQDVYKIDSSGVNKFVPKANLKVKVLVTLSAGCGSCIESGIKYFEELIERFELDDEIDVYFIVESDLLMLETFFYRNPSKSRKSYHFIQVNYEVYEMFNRFGCFYVDENWKFINNLLLTDLKTFKKSNLHFFNLTIPFSN